MVKSFFIRGGGGGEPLSTITDCFYFVCVGYFVYVLCIYTIQGVQNYRVFSHFNDNEKLHIFGHLLTNFFSYVEVHKF